MPPVILSWGGGRQSNAILILIAQGRLPRPDYVVMANTGRERAKTWSYLIRYSLPLMNRLGLRFRLASHELSTVDLYSGNGDLLIPAFTQDGKLPTFCSNEWKKRAVRRWLRANDIDECVMWFGMSLDEIDRMRISDVGWITNHYPLVFDTPMRKHECIKLVEDFGWPSPPISSCWMCPHHKNAEWRDMRDHQPGDWQSAVELDRAIREADRSHGVYLHMAGEPLDEIDLDQPEERLPLFDTCASGFCFV